jgi:hypothetical protein
MPLGFFIEVAISNKGFWFVTPPLERSVVVGHLPVGRAGLQVFSG